MQLYSRNTAKVGIKHQSINQSINQPNKMKSKKLVEVTILKYKKRQYNNKKQITCFLFLK